LGSGLGSGSVVVEGAVSGVAAIYRRIPGCSTRSGGARSETVAHPGPRCRGHGSSARRLCRGEGGCRPTGGRAARAHAVRVAAAAVVRSVGGGRAGGFGAPIHEGASLVVARLVAMANACEGERLRATPPLDRRLPELKVLRQRRCRLQGLRRVIDVLIYAARPPGQARGVRVRGRAIRERVHGSRGAGSRQDERDRGRRLTQPCPSVT
jgi:hypothetical protein